jgi:hypothetical protein
MPDHAAVSSDKSPLLIDGKLAVERAHETLRKSSVGLPSLRLADWYGRQIDNRGPSRRVDSRNIL